MAQIHPTALVDPAAELAETVVVGPWCLIGPHVRLEDGVTLANNVVIEGHTHIGAGTRIGAFAVLGTPPQDTRWKGEPSELVVGAKVIIREHVTLSPGTAHGGLRTEIGDGVMLMINAHVGHDCKVGAGVVITNNVMLAGHVEVGPGAIIGGGAALHQFVRVGRNAMIGGMAGVENDVIPFGLVYGNRARLKGLNLVGLKRRGFAREDIHALRSVYRALFDDDADGTPWAERLARLPEEQQHAAPVAEVLAFIRSDSRRSLCHPERRSGHDG